MAKIPNGILGEVKGKVGPVVGGKWKGINWIRSYVKPSNPNSDAQAVVRSAMQSLIEKARFARPLIFAKGFGNSVKGKQLSTTNQFTKVNMLDRAWVADHTKLQYSKGILAPVPISSCNWYEDTKKMYCELDDEVDGYGSDSDLVCLISGSPSEPNSVIMLDGDTRTISKGKCSTSGTGMYKILSSKGQIAPCLFSFAYNSVGFVSPTLGTVVNIGATDPN